MYPPPLVPHWRTTTIPPFVAWVPGSLPQIVVVVDEAGALDVAPAPPPQPAAATPIPITMVSFQTRLMSEL
jgi:hypothetical protein